MELHAMTYDVYNSGEIQSHVINLDGLFDTRGSGSVSRTMLSQATSKAKKLLQEAISRKQRT